MEYLTYVGLIGIGALAGVLAGLLGVGGGIIMVPLLVLAFGLDQKVAQGTSLAVIIPTAIVGTFTYARGRNLDWRIAVFVAVGALLAAFFGATLAQRLPSLLLKHLFAVLMILVGLRMLIWK